MFFKLSSQRFKRLLRPWQMRTHCCRHKCFPVCPRAQHLLQTQILILFRNILCPQQMFPRKRHEQQCSSSATAFIEVRCLKLVQAQIRMDHYYPVCIALILHSHNSADSPHPYPGCQRFFLRGFRCHVPTATRAKNLWSRARFLRGRRANDKPV